jgi:hypothetical protein
MKKHILSTAIVAALGSTAGTAQALTIQWADNATPTNPYPSAHAIPFGDANLANAFGQYNEFRVAVPDGTGAIAGGGEKSIVGESKLSGAGKATADLTTLPSWDFDSVSGNLIGVANTEMTPGAAVYAPGNCYIPSGGCGTSAAPNGDVGLFRNAAFLGSPFGFLAPIEGSAAAAAYGVGNISFDSTDNFTITFPVLEAQWNGGFFTLGQAADPVVGTGITFNCDGALSGNISCYAGHQIQASEDALGFAGTVTQWELHGTMDPVHVPPTGDVPVPAAVWLFGSGLLGLVGVARRKRTV